MNYPQIKFEPTGREIRRTGIAGTDADFPQRVADLTRDQNPWFLWVTLPTGDVVIREVADISRTERQAEQWWACQGFRPVSKEIAIG